MKEDIYKPASLTNTDTKALTETSAIRIQHYVRKIRHHTKGDLFQYSTKLPHYQKFDIENSLYKHISGEKSGDYPHRCKKQH